MRISKAKLKSFHKNKIYFRRNTKGKKGGTKIYSKVRAKYKINAIKYGYIKIRKRERHKKH